MSPETIPPADVTKLVERLGRFAILCTIGFGAVLLVMEAVGSTVHSRTGLLTERTTMTLLWVIGVELMATVAALACLALWKR